MNRRGFHSLSLLVQVAGVMAARDAMASPALSNFRSFEFAYDRVGKVFIGETIGERVMTPNEARKLFNLPDEIFGVDNIAPAIPARPTEDESVSAQFESDLAFLRDDPGVVS